MLAFILLRSAIPHLENPYQFAHSIANYQLVSGFLVSAIAVVVPVAEMVEAIAVLFIHAWWACAAKVACALSIIFLVAQLQALARGLDISCGCFGSEVDNPIGLYSLVQASSLGVLGGVCLFHLNRPGLRSGKYVR